MANTYNKGRVYIDTASNQAVASTRRLKISYAVIIPDAAGDQCEIKEVSADTNPSIVLSAGTAKEPVFYDFSREPIVMDGVYVDSISANAQVILYTTSRGRS